MKKYLLMLFAALFTFSMSFAETGTETEKEATGGASSNAQVDGQSYYVAGTYIAGKGSAQTGSMTSKGFKLRTGSDGKRVVFTVQTGYTITSLSLTGASNYALNDGGTKEVSVIKVEVDGAEVSFTGGEAFKDRSIGESCTVTVSDIEAKESIAIYFDNGDSKGSQINGTWSISWQRPDATQPTITVTPDKVALVPGATFKLGLRVDPNTFTTKWVSANENIATVSEDGTVTAVAAGEVAIRNEWDTDAAVFGAATINVSDFNAASYLVAKSYDFTAMGDVTLTIGENAAAKIWNEANSVANNVFFCTNAGLEDIAVQAVLSGGKGWSIVDGAGLQLAGGAGRCAAIGNLKAGQVVEIIYTGNNFYTGSKADDKRKDDGALKTALNQGVGRAIYSMDEDGFLGFEIEKGKVVSKITVYEKETLVTVPETADVQTWTLSGSTVGSSSAKYDFPTEVAFDGNDVYVKGLFPYEKTTWAKGTIADGKATFAAGQLIADYGEEKYYILGSNDGETICDFVMAYDADAKTLTQETANIYLNYNKKDAINPEYLDNWQGLKLTFGVEEPVAAPEGLETAAYKMTSTLYYADDDTEPYEGEVQVGFAGDDVYIQGMSSSAAQLWVKATKNAEGKYVVPALQYMGEAGSWFKSKYYIAALDAENAFVDVVFAFDAETNTLTTDQKIVLNKSKDALQPNQTFSGTTTIAKAPEVVDALVVLPETAEVQKWTLTGTTEGSSTSKYEYETEVAFDGDDIYVKGLYPYDKTTWVKGTRYGQNVVFESGQLIADYGEEKTYIVGSFDGTEVSPDFGLIYDEEAKTLTQATEYIYLNFNKKDVINPDYLESWKDLKLTFGVEEPVAAPEGLETAAYKLTSTIYYSEEESEPYEAEVQVGFAGDDAYIQGVAPNAPNMWIKATANADGKYVVPALQYMGETSGWRKMKYYFSALDAENAFVDAVFTYDAEANTFTTDQKLVVNTGKAELNAANTFGGTTTITIAPDPTDVLIVVPEGAELQDWTFEGSFNTNSGTKAVQNLVKVAIVGNDIYAQGFAYYFPEASLKGTIDGTKVTFATGQLVGEDEYGKEYMLGIASDAQTISDIVFDYDAEAQKLTLSAATPYIAESAAKDALSMYGYWTKVSLYAGEPVVPELVELPEGAEVQEYSMAYTDSNNAAATKPVKVAVVGTDVYFQGMSQYLPEAWVKGTITDNVVTFPGNQYMGEYGSYGSSYFFYNGETTFTYDAEKDTYTATGKVFGVLAEQYYDGNYTNPVLSKVNEVAATPATPSITGIEASNYGDVLTFTIPTVDVDGNGLVTSKLSYQFFIDDENTPMVFTPEYFTKLTEDMTVIPYGFTDNYDIADGFIYLNMPHDTWTRIGVQSIYAGAGVENKSEISWFEMPEGPVTAPADLETETYTFSANAKTYGVENAEFEPYSNLVQVGFDGDDAYIQGLAVDMPELWVKATKNAEGKYVIPANQYMGDLSFYGYTFPYYWTGLDADENLVDAVLDFNAETSTFTSQQTMALNGAADELEYYQLYNNVVITKFIEVAATPADPTFEKFDIESEYPEINASIATVGVNGEVLNPEKLFYIVWVDKNGEVAPHTFTAALYPKDFTEDMVEVPYTHDGYDLYLGGEIIYLEEPLEELQTWTKVGIQSVYYGAGERRESNIVWSTATQGISNVKTADDKAVIFDLQGRRVAVPAKGLYIINGKKVVVK